MIPSPTSAFKKWDLTFLQTIKEKQIEELAWLESLHLKLFKYYNP